ncbi:hypothetical protein BFW01_g5085 [Lasiodiplodia theobromae]|nr:hypothetical protein BFW01_g5085 [Lasiodiplodia theobromae]
MGDVFRTNTTATTIAKSGSSRNDNTRSLITRSSTRCSPTAAARDISEARIISLTRSYGLDVDEVERAHLASLPNDRARKVRCRTLLLGERSDRSGGLARASTFVAPGNNLVSPDYFEDLDLGPNTTTTSGGDPRQLRAADPGPGRAR